MFFNVNLRFEHVYNPVKMFYTPQFQIPRNNRAACQNMLTTNLWVHIVIDDIW